jgi:hypothetical protein
MRVASHGFVALDREIKGGYTTPFLRAQNLQGLLKRARDAANPPRKPVASDRPRALVDKYLRIDRHPV